jgi:hypothetical protein
VADGDVIATGRRAARVTLAADPAGIRALSCQKEEVAKGMSVSEAP